MKKIIFAILILSLIFLVGCNKYKSHPCYDSCYPPKEALNDIKSEDPQLYGWLQQIESPECKTFSAEQYAEIQEAKQKGIALMMDSCNGNDTYCDCKMKDGRYVYEELRKRD